MTARATVHDDNPEAGATSREFHLSWLVWVLGILASYPLSTGPVIKIWRGLGLSEQPLREIYAPLIAASKASPVVNGFFDWYVKRVWGTG